MKVVVPVLRRPKPELFQCKICPKKDHGRYLNGTGPRMAKYHVCHSCDFWLTILGYYYQGGEDEHGRRILFIDSQVYMVEAPVVEEGEQSALDMPYVLLDDPDETVFASPNTWCMGHIKYQFRELMPDNARFARSWTRHPFKYEEYV
jgi:hypothetical protein